MPRKPRSEESKMEFEDRVQEVINHINDLEPAKGCTKNFLNRKSFEFIRCGFQKFILDYGLTDYIKYPKTLDELKGR